MARSHAFYTGSMAKADRKLRRMEGVAASHAEQRAEHAKRAELFDRIHAEQRAALDALVPVRWSPGWYLCPCHGKYHAPTTERGTDMGRLCPSCGLLALPVEPPASVLPFFRNAAAGRRLP